MGFERRANGGNSDAQKKNKEERGEKKKKKVVRFLLSYQVVEHGDKSFILLGFEILV